MCFLRKLAAIFHPLEKWRFYVDKNCFIGTVMNDLLKTFNRLRLELLIDCKINSLFNRKHC